MLLSFFARMGVRFAWDEVSTTSRYAGGSIQPLGRPTRYRDVVLTSSNRQSAITNWQSAIKDPPATRVVVLTSWDGELCDWIRVTRR